MFVHFDILILAIVVSPVAIFTHTFNPVSEIWIVERAAADDGLADKAVQGNEDWAPVHVELGERHFQSVLITMFVWLAKNFGDLR